MTDMASTVWSTVQSAAPAGLGGVVGGGDESGGAMPDPQSLINAQLASALSTMGDAQFFEESISPSTVRSQLSNADPSNPSSTPNLLRGMKWLLACMSKGRDVSDFFPHVVKLVGATSLEIRKMVYMYLVQYADHDASCRELALLSINSFQRGLADAEQLIRALALRVLSSIRVPDILQIQILGVQKCARDNSPYVRKCAANALSKLSPRCDSAQRDMLTDIMRRLLDDDTSTMVLTSAVVAFAELCPDRLELLHVPFRKLCHLLTDMDEWGQVVVIDTLARYCRRYFREPRNIRYGSAEQIDRERRVRRTVGGIARSAVEGAASSSGRVGVGEALDELLPSSQSEKDTDRSGGHIGRGSVGPKKIKRRVVRKAFYSDEEDESSEEEVYAQHPHGTPLSVANAMRQRNVMGFGGGADGGVFGAQLPRGIGGGAAEADEDEDLDEDHRLLLKSSLPLLKSRNAGVVLAVCSLHYYCGVSSIKVRSALGKSLVRIHRDRREIQYVVLTSIKSLVNECPSAFTPFLNDFFVKAMDPSFTRIIKLDILTALTLEPASINAVLKELRSYIRHDDKSFVCAAIRAVGKVAELARIVHDRQGRKTGDIAGARAEANIIALNCLYGLMTLSESSENTDVVGECVVVMQRIISQLLSEDSGDDGAILNSVEDPNHVQSTAMRRLLVLLVRALSFETTEDENEERRKHDDSGRETDEVQLQKCTVELPAESVAPGLWIIGEWFTSKSLIPLFDAGNENKALMRSELLRLLANSFPDLEPCVKEQAVHFSSKILLSSKDRTMGTKSGAGDAALCELMLAMGRVDVNQDVRDRSRYESGVLYMSIGLSHDIDTLPTLPPSAKSVSMKHAKAMLLRRKPTGSSVPIDDKEHDKQKDETELFRFGTLSSLVSHRAGRAYLPLPVWAEKDSPSSLRDPPAPSEQQERNGMGDGWKVDKTRKTESHFYDSDEESTSTDDGSTTSDESSTESSTSESEVEESTSEEEEDSSEEESSEEESDSEVEEDILRGGKPSHIANGGVQKSPAFDSSQINKGTIEEVSSGEDSEGSDSDESSGSSENEVQRDASEGNLLPMMTGANPASNRNLSKHTSSSSSIAEGLEGLVMAPLVMDKSHSTKSHPGATDAESSIWKQLVRPELGGGLSVKARFLRGSSRTREAKVIGLDPDSATTVCLQMSLENRRTDAGILRHVRLVQRGGGGSGTITTRRVVVPQEILALKKGQMSTVLLGLDFVSPSDRDGALSARFDVKSDRGTNPVEIRVPLGEMLKPSSMTTSDYDATVNRLQGIHQRITSSFDLSSKDTYEKLPQQIMKYVNMTPVGKPGWKGGKCSFAGTLPASGDQVCVTISCDAQTGSGEIMICSDNAMASNGVLDVLKRAVSYTDQTS